MLAHFVTSIAHGGAESHIAQHGQVRQIVADKANAIRREVKFGNNLLDNRKFVIDALAHELHSELHGTKLDDVRGAAGHQAEGSPGTLPEVDRQTIANVEAFDLDAAVVEDDAPTTP